MNRRTYIGAGAAVLAGLAGCVGSFTRGDAYLLETRGDTRASTELSDITASVADGYVSLRTEFGDVSLRALAR